MPMRSRLVAEIAALGFTVAAAALPTVAAGQSPAGWVEHPKISSRISQFVAIHREQPQQARCWAATNGIDLDVHGRVLVEVRMAANPQSEPALSAKVHATGAALIHRGSDRLDVRATPQQIAQLATHTEFTWLGSPLAPIALSQTFSAGCKAIGADVFHCAAKTGSGVKIAVVDSNFDKWASAIATGDLPNTEGAPPNIGSAHGTACAEVIADLAPGATVIPVAVNSVAALQAWVAQTLAGSSIAIVHSAVGWFGESFGDGKGAVCQAVSAGVGASRVWVAAAGNMAAGKLWTDLWRDDNKDGWLEFAPGAASNEFEMPVAGPVQVILDWDAYPTTATDLDLQVCRVLPKDCSPVAVSTGIQDGSQPPVEALIVQVSVTGVYAVRVKHKSGPMPTGVRVQLPNYYGMLQHYRTDHTLVDPANCAEALVIAAIAVDGYGNGLPEAASSQGPTADGRPKPDIGAPSGVATSVVDYFEGTSAAAAHVSGAVALWMSQSGLDAKQAAAQLLLAAVPRPATTAPDLLSGAGRLNLPVAKAGVPCLPGELLTCSLACGSKSTALCDANCHIGQCFVPFETCDSTDENCNGQTDEGFACKIGAQGPCYTPCGTTGIHQCTKACAWAGCVPPAEVCNGSDDNCDGHIDEGFSCTPGAEQACSVGGLEGFARCSSACAWQACVANEVCNGKDDNGDGLVDEELACPVPQAKCSATPVAGSRSRWLVLLIMAALAVGTVSLRRVRDAH
ncbi:MAG: hypothetical protein EXR77_05695 [Myxococcales bacterium]|nr:hypothetical protein [Myxococcales bacterium]